MWSPFFDRTFKSQFSVAKSDVFIIDPNNNEDYKALCAVLKHIHGMEFGDHIQNDPEDWSSGQGVLDRCIKVYTVADKYDFPSVRRQVIELVNDHLRINKRKKSSWQSVRSVTPGLAEHIASICGPNAPQLADLALRDTLFDWLAGNFDLVSQEPEIKAKIEDGSLLDDEFTPLLLLRLAGMVHSLIEEKIARG